MPDKNEKTIEIVDARGLSCPQPVIMLRGKIKEIEKGRFAIVVDNETARENVIRAAGNRGWVVESIEDADDEFRITFGKD